MKYNGTSYSWGQIFVKLQSMDEPFVGITNVSYTMSKEKENIYGQGYDPINRGYGNNQYEGSMTLKLEEVRNLIESSPNNNLLDRLPEDLIITYKHPVSDMIVTDVIKNIDFTEVSFEASQNDMSIEIELPFIASGVITGAR